MSGPGFYLSTVKIIKKFKSYKKKTKHAITFPKSRTSKRSNASKSSLFLIPNVSQQAVRNVRMFFKQRNWRVENSS
jgi:hypothetical protein